VFVNLASGRAALGLGALLALAARISLVVLPVVAADAATPKTDFAKGKGTASANDPGSQNIHFQFNVQAADTDPSTDAATGSFSLKQGEKASPTGKKRFVKGSLSCLDSSTR
jgi:hypothetical protein